MGTGGRGAAEVGALEGRTGIGFVNPEEGTLGFTGGPGCTIGGSRSEIRGKFSLGKIIGACLNWSSVF
jgi:hypothetical protein